MRSIALARSLVGDSVRGGARVGRVTRHRFRIPEER
jgi:hypothetical protein